MLNTEIEPASVRSTTHHLTKGSYTRVHGTLRGPWTSFKWSMIGNTLCSGGK